MSKRVVKVRKSKKAVEEAPVVQPEKNEESSVIISSQDPPEPSVEALIETPGEAPGEAPAELSFEEQISKIMSQNEPEVPKEIAPQVSKNDTLIQSVITQHSEHSTGGNCPIDYSRNRSTPIGANRVPKLANRV